MVYRAIKVKHKYHLNVNKNTTKRHAAALLNWTGKGYHLTVNKQLIPTKGDNNEVDEVALCSDRRQYDYRDEIVSLVKCHVPLVEHFNLPYVPLAYVALLDT